MTSAMVVQQAPADKTTTGKRQTARCARRTEALAPQEATREQLSREIANEYARKYAPVSHPCWSKLETMARNELKQHLQSQISGLESSEYLDSTRDIVTQLTDLR